ncbi:helix-turn-helix transcriptional regulator [uncultured Roseobacter sp.]|uniref:helix-turn-helix domain-containing protein n=1 Tax=uncultured Roseobacter sp. TaxID=114847 RepID=UPI00260F8E32|nr:helix-turn-helix transcriptional regulator [uncultured Roseobacter sp.]
MKTFVESFIEHVRASETPIAELSRRTGVSKSKMDALMNRRAKSTTVDDAMKISKFFGKSVEEFCSTPPDPKILQIISLVQKLSPQERDLVEGQLRGLRALRDAPRNRPH